MNKSMVIASLSLMVFIPGMMPAQDLATILHQAQKEEKSFHDPEALSKYREALEIQPNNLHALCRTSELYSLIGKRLSNKTDQKNYFLSGRRYAQLALKTDPNSSAANLAMALAMGRIALISSGEEKVRAGKEIKSYAEKAIRLDPKNYKAYHILGKWQYEVSDLNPVEKFLMKMVYGELPAASLEDAQRYYEKSKQINPGFLINYLELARVYSKKEQYAKAREMINTMLSLPTSTSDDPRIRQLGKEMLEQLD
ncbi:MAG TPA: hypothetical protein VK628_06295 [Flavitalea sp.]|nr:hypothetical protein [Flavitalea sp.]